MTGKLINNYDLIIFDCDGVLIDVNLLKCEAFGMAVEEYPKEIVNSFVENCKNTFGISRYVKFRDFFKDFANEPYNEKKYKMFLESYAVICKQIYNDAEITPGTNKLLEELNNSKKQLYVASGSDEKELNEAFKSRNLHNYFNGIFGSPKTKLECVSLILENHPNNKVAFIGDAISDLKTAKHHNMDFIYMSNYTVQSKEQDEICRKESILEIKTLEELL